MKFPQSPSACEMKENISRDLFGKSAQQIKEYLRANSLKMKV
jgi:hypothetical protein